MYQFIIVDDEEIIRSGLAKYFDWPSIGFEPIGQFEDGKDAIEYLQKNSVDAVLTDVKMYEISGIQLAKYVFEHCPQTKVIILSGYKEFDFAKEAMSYGVCDYILKPVNREEIRSVFLRVRDILDKERRERETAATLPFSYCDGSEYQEILSCNNRLVAAVVAGNAEEVYNIHEEWFALISGAPHEFLFFAISNMFEEIYIRFARMGIHLEDRLEKEKVFERLGGIETGELFMATGKLLLEFCDFLSDKKENAEENMIVRAKQYIARHLSENFSIEDVAKSVFLSSSYFSREFKNHTGENVIDYVIRCRMTNAIELIKQGKYNANEISAMVGYADSKYFHRSFKKFTGYTVREYQKLVH